MRDDRIYIQHIIESIEKIESYTKQLGKEDFIKSGLIQDAVIRNLEIIGEATKNISKEFRQNHNKIPWINMAGMRDVLIHDYFGVDLPEKEQALYEDLSTFIRNKYREEKPSITRFQLKNLQEQMGSMFASMAHTLEQLTNQEGLSEFDKKVLGRFAQRAKEIVKVENQHNPKVEHLHMERFRSFMKNRSWASGLCLNSTPHSLQTNGKNNRIKSGWIF